MTTIDLSERRRPRFRLPRGGTDAHCHVFGPGDVFPYAAQRRYTPADAPKQMLAALHDHLGIDRCVIVQASCHGTDNSAMLDAIAADPARRRGIAIVDAGSTERKLTRLHEGGVRGARFNFVRHLGGAPNQYDFDRIVGRIISLGMGWHLVLHLDAQDIPQLSPMIKALSLPFVIDHMGRVDTSQGLEQPAFRALLELVRRDNGWVKVSGAERISDPPFTAAVPFARALIDAAPRRVLWGTDFPHPNLERPVDEADLVDLIPQLAPTPELQHALLVANPARLYGFI